MNIFRKACITLAMIFSIQSSAAAQDDVGKNLIITIGAGTAALIAAHAYLKNKHKKKSNQSNDSDAQQLFNESGQSDASDTDYSLFQGNNPYEEYQDEIDTYDPGIGRVDVGDNVLAKNETAELRRNLKKNGELPKKGCAAHHIVPQGDGRGHAVPYRGLSAKILIDCGIDIHSAENGVYLPYKKDGSAECSGSYHPPLHDGDYYKRIFAELYDANLNGCDEVHEALLEIKNNLKAGTFP